jgi:predicted transcriptional regulator
MTDTLHVTVDTPADRADLDERLAAIDADEEIELADATLAVESLETFGRVFRPTNLRLLEAITNHEPESLRELARIVDRNPPDVLDNINELETYGLVELVEEGRSKRPVVWYDEINVDMPLTDSTTDTDAATA